MGSYVIGVDESTGETKAILYDREGNEVSLGRATYNTISPKPGWMEQDAEWWWSALKESMAQLLLEAQVRDV